MVQCMNTPDRHTILPSLWPRCSSRKCMIPLYQISYSSFCLTAAVMGEGSGRGRKRERESRERERVEKRSERAGEEG